MREKWKLCVISGSILFASVLGTLVLLNRTMSFADDRGEEFEVMQAASGSSVAGQAVSGGSVSENPVPHKELGENQPAEEGSYKKNGTKTENETKSDLPEEPQDEADEERTSSSSSACIEMPEEGWTDEDKTGNRIVSYAREFLGVSYVYGGTSLPSYQEMKKGSTEKGTEENYGVDCSGLVMKVYENFDIKLPRTVKEQAEAGKEVKLKDAGPGDLIFYGANNSAVTHCGIYAGDGQVIHVSAQTQVVTMDDVNYRRIVKVKRVVSE